MSQPLLVFDMDGVLVDVTDSYRETIARTVEHFTGVPVTPDAIQDVKNQGGFNDDWELSHHMIATAGVTAAFDDVVAHFQKLFLGVDGVEGLIRRERWIANPGALEALGERFRFAVFTGRPRDEAHLTLDRFARNLVFDPIIGMHDVEKKKPAPDGLQIIAAKSPGEKLYYIGDSVDDARSAEAAGVAFIGIAAPANPRYLDLVFAFQEIGAYAIVDDINYLHEVFAS
jgi:HAD superfamily phosphatase